MRRPSPTPAPATPRLDPRTPGVVLEFVGGRTKRYVPGRDLEAVDIERIAYRRAADLERAGRTRSVPPGGQLPPPKRPGPPSAAAIEAVVEELVATGTFSRVAKPTQPASRRHTTEA